MDELVVIRQVPNPKSVYLTFDDGPDPEHTPQILDLLKKHDSHATFFVIGQKAVEHPKLIKRFLDEGHSVGDHSWNHSYREYFRTLTDTKAWVQKSQEKLNELLRQTPIGFRPPAGVQTPKLRRILREMKIPLILWNRRYFDTVFGFSERRAALAARRLNPGDIVLLHDRSCGGIEVLLKELKERGLSSAALKY